MPLFESLDDLIEFRLFELSYDPVRDFDGDCITVIPL